MRRRTIRVIAEQTLARCRIDDTDRADDPATHHFGVWRFGLDKRMRVYCQFHAVRTDDPETVARFTSTPNGGTRIWGRTREEVVDATLTAALNAVRWAMSHEIGEHFHYGESRPFVPEHAPQGKTSFRSSPVALLPREQWAS